MSSVRTTIGCGPRTTRPTLRACGAAAVEGPPTGGTIRGYWDANVGVTTSGSDLAIWEAAINNPLIDNGDSTFTDSGTGPTYSQGVGVGLGNRAHMTFSFGGNDGIIHASGGDRYLNGTGPETIYILCNFYTGPAGFDNARWFEASDQSYVRTLSMSSYRPRMVGNVAFIRNKVWSTGWSYFMCSYGDNGVANSTIGGANATAGREWIAGTHNYNFGSITNSKITMAKEAGQANPINMQLAEVIIVDGADTQAEGEAVFSFWNDRYGFSL